jgi:hypothetical protein
MHEDGQMERLVRTFADGVRTWSRSRLCDPDEAARASKAFWDAFDQLRIRYGDRGRDALKALFQNPDPAVRSAAAAFLLRHCTEEALLILEEVAKEKGVAAFDARASLERWKDGTWSLD